MHVGGGPSPKLERDKKNVNWPYKSAEDTLRISPILEQIPALSALSSLSAFSRNPPGRPVDVGIHGHKSSRSRQK